MEPNPFSHADTEKTRRERVAHSVTLRTLSSYEDGMGVVFSDPLEEAELSTPRHERAPMPTQPFGRRAEDVMISERDRAALQRPTWERQPAPQLGFQEPPEQPFDFEIE